MSFLLICLFLAVALSVSIVFWRVLGRNHHQRGLGRVMRDMSQTVKASQSLPHVEPELSTISWVSFYLATDQPWTGQEVVDALHRHGLTLGSDGLFIFEDDGYTWFRVAQATHPVSFDMDLLNDTVLSGLAFFMDATEVPMPKKVFRKMVLIMKQLTQSLNGLLVDQSQHPLTPEDLTRIEKQLPQDESVLAE